MEKTEVLNDISSSSAARTKNKPLRAPGPAYYGTLKYAVRTPNKSLFGVKKGSSNNLCLMALKKMQKFPTRPRSMKINLGEIAGYMITESEKDEIVKRERDEMLKERKETAAEEEQRMERAEQQKERLRREKKLKKPAESSNYVQQFHCRSEKRRGSSGIQINENRQENEEEHDDSSCRPKKKLNIKPTTRKFSKDGPNPPPNIPPELLQKIRSLNGHGETLVIQKGLYKTDVNHEQHRFSIPLNKIRKEIFLTPKEVKLLETRVYNPDTKKSSPSNMEVVFIDPDLRVMDMNFRLWEYKKDGGKKSSSWSYVFVSKWMEVVDKNDLKEGSVVQVWAFRVGETLHFAMNVIERENGEEKKQVKEDGHDF